MSEVSEQGTQETQGTEPPFLPHVDSIVSSESEAEPEIDDSAPIRGLPGAGKIREWEHRDHAGFAGSGWFSRVRSLAPGELVPAACEMVPAETPDSDWAMGRKE